MDFGNGGGVEDDVAWSYFSVQRIVIVGVVVIVGVGVERRIATTIISCVMSTHLRDYLFLLRREIELSNVPIDPPLVMPIPKVHLLPLRRQREGIAFLQQGVKPGSAGFLGPDYQK